MKVTILGCSGSFAGPDSPASSYLVRVDDGGRTWNLLFDLGSGALGPMQRHIAPRDVDAVFVTHLHPDHCADLCGLYVARHYNPGGAPTERVPVWGPTGTAKRLALMYHGLEHHALQQVFDFRLLEDQVAIEVGPVRVVPYAVNHPVEAFGFRIEAQGQVLAYTGDTDTCDNLTPLLRDADLVLSDSAFMDGRDDEFRGVHLTPSRAAQAALDAGGVKRLMLTHMPAWNDPAVCREQAAALWPDVEMVEFGATYEVGSGDLDSVGESGAV
ncbi:MBL fold metallo-hydrolase [Knoellia subterranea]|uniref:Metal-dependent hydrolase n=1 Tax=Knoellia subterranea KCTC 19937 TaxID=1385521 RepID=A0A0A0JR52_9MICO|nr:MBL fold metallo-hydrolase [Knoellia subterranea]KGN39219.1 metal-dependent hydrolase [Knoellia subterranea KCTC 19937]